MRLSAPHRSIKIEIFTITIEVSTSPFVQNSPQQISFLVSSFFYPNCPDQCRCRVLILKDFLSLMDEEITESCELDFRYQFVLYTTSFEYQLVGEESMRCFRSRLATYELTTGEELLHQCFTEMEESMEEYMEISSSIKWMESMMIESNIRKLGRLELLYTCFFQPCERAVPAQEDRIVRRSETLLGF